MWEYPPCCGLCLASLPDVVVPVRLSHPPRGRRQTYLAAVGMSCDDGWWLHPPGPNGSAAGRLPRAAGPLAPQRSASWPIVTPVASQA